MAKSLVSCFFDSRCSAWPCGVMARALDSLTQKVAGSNPGRSLSGNNLGQVVHTYVPLSPSSTIWNRSNGDVLGSSGVTRIWCQGGHDDRGAEGASIEAPSGLGMWRVSAPQSTRESGGAS